MQVTEQIAAFLAEKKQALSLSDLIVLESTNGFILASTASGDAMDLESLGSLTSGALTAFDMLSTLFASGQISYLLMETAEKNFLLQRVEENYFLIASAPKQMRVGYLRLRAEKILPDLAALVRRFCEENAVSIGDIDIDEITASLDAQFDELLKGGDR